MPRPRALGYPALLFSALFSSRAGSQQIPGILLTWPSASQGTQTALVSFFCWTWGPQLSSFCLFTKCSHLLSPLGPADNVLIHLGPGLVEMDLGASCVVDGFRWQSLHSRWVPRGVIRCGLVSFEVQSESCVQDSGNV